jgi:colanic acid/amylovoran biosynthesis protein
MGVSKDRVFVTGDDAIEMAHALRPQHIGEGLGINLRMASYAGMTAIVTENVRDAIKTFAARNKTELVPLPIDHARDLAAIKEHFYQANDDLNGRSQDSSVGNIIAEVGRCRVIVTGSYHAAVFGLAQGIPSIGLANSDYYRNKFGGLEDMFGEGSTLIDLRAPDHVKQLSRTLDEFWQNAEAIRPGLLSASVVQIESGLAAYRELAKL